MRPLRQPGQCLLQPGSRTHTVYQLVSEGPALCAEIAAELGWPIGLTSCYLAELTRRGYLTRTRFPTGDKRIRTLYTAV